MKNSKRRDSKTRVGFIGCGGIAHWCHFNRLPQIPDLEISALFDVSRSQVDNAMKKFPRARAYGSAGDLIEHSGVDAVYVCVPPMSHGEAEMACVKVGMPMFVEKPLANNLRTAKAILAAVKKSKVLCSVGYHWRYSDLSPKGRAFLKGKTVQLGLGAWLGGLPGAKWWRTKSQGGGQHVEQTTHIFDLARYYLGDVRKVQALKVSKGRASTKEYDVEDATVVNLEFKSGAIVNISSTTLLDGMPGRADLFLYGDQFQLEHQGDVLKLRTPGEAREISRKADPYLEESKAFITAVRTGSRKGIESSYEDALRTLAVSLAADESMRNGKAVEVARI